MFIAVPMRKTMRRTKGFKGPFTIAPTEFMAELFPRGIGRANAYDTFRRTALQLALYVRVHGTTPGAAYCSDLIEQIIAFYQQQYEEAMQAEEEATGINPEAALESAN